MTHRKRQSTRKMEDYKNNKLEIAQEMGYSGANNTEVNAKIASQDEAKYSTKSVVKKNNLHNPQKSAQDEHQKNNIH
ncbi:hypothetical protein CHL78_006980 [Romboutsia weinsteinii]|uniref:Uncharacterized protein n=1 Tax=Romboutsia weinsteinii TaxID=2020949 RepID=A0A371J5H6_9FIRM|nr:hypothetical protein [Romboutsia weinsteinii]RDY28040.1 hypothetical protein CHL78_006980 [Romboutsia weinsteinii]